MVVEDDADNCHAVVADAEVAGAVVARSAVEKAHLDWLRVALVVASSHLKARAPTLLQLIETLEAAQFQE